MPTQPQVTPTNDKFWTNRHNTFIQAIDNLFDIANGDTGNSVNDYNATTVAIQQLIARAVTEKKAIRALGGGWSFTKVAATDGWLINTKQLNMAFTLTVGSVAPQYKGQAGQLLFAQCGMSIQELNTYLKNTGKSLKTCGASNGQTLVGAFSTGTHGSAIDIGATPDFVTGLHIILSAEKHVWLERASYPVVSDSFVKKLNTELLRDDELFNAAVVSFGSFGFIHGAMIETEPVYLLECYRLRLPLDESMKYIMQTLDFSDAVSLPHGNERPFHFQVVIDQYDVAGGTFCTVMYKRPYKNNYPAPGIEDPTTAGPGDDVPAFLGKVTDLLPVVTALMVNELVKKSYTLYNNIQGTCGEIFTNNNIRGRVLSTALGIPINFAGQVNDLLIRLNGDHGPFTGIFSYRYVKKSSATLAFTKYDHTLILELDGVESAITRNFYEVVWAELEKAGIPYTFHMGKIGNLDPVKMRKIYGADVDRWIAARNKLLPVASMNLFNNQTLKDWGLDIITSSF